MSPAAVPSAPFDTTGAGSPRSGANSGSGGDLVSSAQSYLASLPLSLSSISLFGARRPAAAGDGYSALPGEELEMSVHGTSSNRSAATRGPQGTEMVPLGSYPSEYSPYTLTSAASVAPAPAGRAQTHYAAVPVQMMVPVTARPINASSISMV